VFQYVSLVQPFLLSFPLREADLLCPQKVLDLYAGTGLDDRSGHERAGKLCNIRLLIRGRIMNDYRSALSLELSKNPSAFPEIAKSLEPLDLILCSAPTSASLTVSATLDPTPLRNYCCAYEEGWLVHLQHLLLVWYAVRLRKYEVIAKTAAYSDTILDELDIYEGWLQAGEKAIYASAADLAKVQEWGAARYEKVKATLQLAFSEFRAGSSV
jgi:hypothetical protein